MKLATLKGLFNENISITISSLPCTFGRSRSADFIIAHVNVSRNHCEIAKDNSSWKISDYSSSGTYINDLLVGNGKSVFLNNGDIIRFGPLESKLCWSFNVDESSEPEALNLTLNEIAEKEIKSLNEVGMVSESAVLKGNSVTSTEEKGCDDESKREKTELTKETLQVQCDVIQINDEKYSIQSNKKSDFLENITDVLETEFQCTICSELFLTAVTLGCTHTFCKYCIDQWKKKQKTCPICRKKITNETRSLVLDNYIDKMVENLSSELKKRRDAIIKERNEAGPSKKRSKLKTRKS